jgi:hypothetical protein
MTRADSKRMALRADRAAVARSFSKGSRLLERATRRCLLKRRTTEKLLNEVPFSLVEDQISFFTKDLVAGSCSGIL